MATTSPDNLRTPDPGDSYNLVPDLATLAGDVQAALLLRDNITGSGTASQRTAFTSSAPDGFLWQDTDGIKMIWRKDGAVWVPAVWRWSGTNTQMNSFSPPGGFKWFNTTDNSEYVRLGGAWVSSHLRTILTRNSSPLTVSGAAFTNLAPGFSLSSSAPGITWNSNRFTVTSAGRYKFTGNVLVTVSTGVLICPSTSSSLPSFPTNVYSFTTASSAAGECGISANMEFTVAAGGNVYPMSLAGASATGTLRTPTATMTSWIGLERIS